MSDDIIPITLEQELQTSYIDYAMSVIMSRAVPDARDGLKPVQRRILYAMYMLKNFHNLPTKKSARIVGEIIGKWHPHGDIAVYESLVRLAQWFAMNHKLVEGQGNFGCFTKDTKIRLADGRDIDFEHLIREQGEGKRHWAFSFNPTTKQIGVEEVKNPRLTRKAADLVEVTLDNGEKIRCTPDHRFMQRDGTYKEAKDLKAGASLMPLYTKTYDGKNDKNLKDYDMVLQPITNRWNFIHHLSDEWNLKEGIYTKARGRIRHHLDINKKNNNPNNIQRLNWKEHWQIHYELASWRHKHDPIYVKKLADGRKKYIETHHELLSERTSERNKENWKKPAYRRKHIQLVKTLWKNQEYRAKMSSVSSEHLKEKWADKGHQELMSKIKSREMKERWNSKTYRKHMAELTRDNSLKRWRDPRHREHISKLMKEKASDPAWRATVSARSKKLWSTPEYRSKFSDDHFSKMSRNSWASEKNVAMQKEKARKQWRDPIFRAKMIELIRKRDIERVRADPHFMQKLALSAGRALHQKWNNPEYKKQVIKSKILGYVSKLLTKYPTITPMIYNSERQNNGIPTADHALKYFSSFDQIVEDAKTHNHKVVSVCYLDQHEDTYDLTIGPWHNFALSSGVFVHNSIDGDPPAAMRYTEVRLTKLAEEMLEDLEKGTVEFIPNFDNTETEPILLPSKVPNLLVNGASGIAVGVATSMPPHNMNEVCDAVIHVLDHKEATTEDILAIIPGPDFPTGGIAIMTQNAYNGYKHGRGQTTIRAKADIDEKKHKIIITEIPYNVNKATLVHSIAELVREKRVVGVKDLRDESDKQGIRIVIDTREDANPAQVLNTLYKYTQLEFTFPIINLAVVGKSLKSLNILQLITTFIDHRREVVLKRSKYDLNVANDRLHILDGLLIAIDHIENIIKDIRASNEISEAREKLMKGYKLTDKQANAILDMKLSRLTHLENETLKKEASELQKRAEYLNKVIGNPEIVDKIIKEETLEIKKAYGKPRKTEIIKTDEIIDIKDEDMITDEKISIILTNAGYVKRQPQSVYKEQGRGGKGVIAINLKEGDYVRQILTCHSKDYLVCISNAGRAYWLKAYNVPESSRYSEGKAIVNLLDIKGETIVDILNIKDFMSTKVVFLTKKGLVKKTNASLFSKPRSSGIKAITLKQGDEIADVILTSTDKYLHVITKDGQAIRFEDQKLRPIGRSAAGVHGIRLRQGDTAKNIISASDIGSILTITEKGYGKITDVNEYRVQSRGGKGVINLKVSAKTGPVSKAIFVSGEQSVILINSKGISITIPTESIRVTGRAASGVRLMRLEDDAKVVDARLMEEETEVQQNAEPQPQPT
jgi:DNA gyrase/topoisomerase IV subunit A